MALETGADLLNWGRSTMPIAIQILWDSTVDPHMWRFTLEISFFLCSAERS